MDRLDPVESPPVDESTSTSRHTYICYFHVLQALQRKKKMFQDEESKKNLEEAA